MAERDYIVRATAADEFIRAFAITSRGIAETARRAHDLTPVATAALGRLLSATAMMGTMMKGDKDVLTVRIDASGPLKGLLATADSHGNVKGYVGNPNAEAPDRPDGHLGVGAAVGIGVMSVIKDLGLRSRMSAISSFRAVRSQRILRIISQRRSRHRRAWDWAFW